MGVSSHGSKFDSTPIEADSNMRFTYGLFSKIVLAHDFKFVLRLASHLLIALSLTRATSSEAQNSYLIKYLWPSCLRMFRGE